MSDTKAGVLNLFSGKKVLVTGGSGFIGGLLLRQLIDGGADVHSTSRVERTSDTKNLTWWAGSFEHFDEAKKIFQGVNPDVIFHLAGQVTAASDLKYVLTTYHSHLTSTVNLLTVAAEIGCQRIVLTGSSIEPSEQDPYPNSPYAAAKWAANAYAHLFQKVYNSPVVVVRPFMGYGPTQAVSKIIPYVILSFLKNESPKLSNATWLTDCVYVEDTIEGILAAGALPHIEGNTIDLGSGVLTTIKEIVEIISDIMQPQQAPVFGALQDRHQEPTRIANTEQAFRIINWKAKTSLHDGLKKTIEWYRNNYTGT